MKAAPVTTTYPITPPHTVNVTRDSESTTQAHNNTHSWLGVHTIHLIGGFVLFAVVIGAIIKERVGKEKRRN